MFSDTSLEAVLLFIRRVIRNINLSIETKNLRPVEYRVRIA